eukprot:symbB.v1.2.030491.t2/scaffold3435.1/size56750/1
MPLVACVCLKQEADEADEADATLEEAKGSQDLGMEEQLRRFWDRYPMDDRATQLLLGCPAHLQKHVIDTFDPKNKQEVDYSRQVTGYIRSLQTEDMVGHKRGHEEHHREAKRSRVEVPPPSEDEIMNFCQRYPVDDRALDYLQASDPAVLSEFRPKVENEPDYSSLVTSLVKKMRLEMRGVVGHSPGGSPGLPANHSTRGPTLARLREFRDQFPMDERAWDYLFSSPGYVQEVVVNEFNPRRPDDTDFSAPVVVNEFNPRRPDDTDFSAPACFENTLVACCQDGAVKLWDLRVQGNKAERCLREPAEEPVISVAVADSICACAVDTSVLLLDTSSVTAGDDGLLCVVDSERTPEDDDALKIAMNSEESVERFSFAADGGMLCSISTTDVLQLWSLKPPKEGVRCGRIDHLRSEERLKAGNINWTGCIARLPGKVGESDGHLVDVLYDQQSGTAYVLASSDGLLCLWRAEAKANPSGAVKVTAFVKSMLITSGGMESMSLAKLESFREKYPMDDKAFDYICATGFERQSEVLQNFNPRNDLETDYSRQITAFLTLRAKTASQGGYGEEPRHDWQSHADTREASAPRRGSVFVNAAVPSYKRLSDPRDVHPKGDGKGGSRLQAFRASAPDPHVQDMFMAEFQPPRRGRDNDYSASVTSFLKVVRNKMQYSHPISSTVFPPARGLTSEMTGDDADAMLEGFRRRYPMDDKAFDYVYQQNDEIRRKVVNNFKPKFEGEADYSGLITAYVKSCRPW